MNNGIRAISICGPSGSGKSTVAKAVVELLGEARCVRIPGDWFIVPATGSLEEFWQRPLAYDWNLMARLLSSPNDAVVGMPDFDFDRFVRRSENGGVRLVMRPIRVIDVLIPYPNADVTFRISVPADVRRERLIARDLRWGSNVIDRWEHLEQTQRDDHGIRRSVFELSGLQSPGELAREIAMAMKLSS